MAAAYDTFDYPAYWKGRDYENKSEVAALKSFLHEIPKIHTIVEIGAGFGRMIPFYSFRAKKVIVTDPSARLLSIPRSKFKNKKNISFIQSTIENLPGKIKTNSADLVIMIRVLHHITNIEATFKLISRLLRPGGYVILEFANKEHFKSILNAISKGNLGYLKDEETIDVRSTRSKKLKTLPFYNFHPTLIEKTLAKNNLQIIDKLSVSNIRSPFLKGIFTTDLLVSIESFLQKPLSYLNFGPSLFVLARKRA